MYAMCAIFMAAHVLYQFNQEETGQIKFSRLRKRARHRKLIKHKLKVMPHTVQAYNVFVFFSCWINQKQKKSQFFCFCWVAVVFVLFFYLWATNAFMIVAISFISRFKSLFVLHYTRHSFFVSIYKISYH